MKKLDLQIECKVPDDVDIQVVVDQVNEALKRHNLTAAVIWPTLKNKRTL